MLINGIIPVHVDSANWQDYRGSDIGMVVCYNTDPVSSIPIREVPEEIPSDIIPEPNYETGTFGFYGCRFTKMRNIFVKKKIGYLFFMTKYAGTKVEFADDNMVTGFYRIKQIVDAKKLHIRYLNEYSCLSEDFCYALHADQNWFVTIEDAFKITDEVLKSWNYQSRITRQTKIMLDEEKCGELLEYLKSKKNIVDIYIDETVRLSPGTDYDEDEDEDEEDE